MWLFITTSDKYERALSLVGGHFYLNYEEDDNGNENRRAPYIELAYPVHRFVLKFEPAPAAEQFYQRLKSAIKIGRTQFDSTEEGFTINYMEEEPVEVQVSSYEDAVAVRVAE
jgi:hypothetical protein